MIQFSAASYSVNEGAGSVTITVTRSGNTSGTASVQYATSDVSAVRPGDYNAASGTLTFAQGESSKSFTVITNDDLIKESSETFNITLSNVSNATLGNQFIVTVNILDNDKRLRGPQLDTRVGKLKRKR